MCAGANQNWNSTVNVRNGMRQKWELHCLVFWSWMCIFHNLQAFHCKAEYSISQSGSRPALQLAPENGVFIGATAVSDEQPLKPNVCCSENRTGDPGASSPVLIMSLSVRLCLFLGMWHRGSQPSWSVAMTEGGSGCLDPPWAVKMHLPPHTKQPPNRMQLDGTATAKCLHHNIRSSQRS